LEEAWEPVLFNQAHDLSSGVMLDKVYEDSIDRYRHAKHLGDGILNDRLREMLARIDTRGAGTPLVVFNLLGWARTDIVEPDLGFAQANVMSMAVVDSNGKRVPCQVMNSRRDESGAILSAKLAFIAHDVPALGYAVYHVVDAAQAPPAVGQIGITGKSATSDRDDEGVLENEFDRATFDLWTGAMKSLVLKKNQWEVLAAPANIVAREEDGGDFWELYGTLNGARFTSMKRNIGAPKAGVPLSSDSVGGNGSVSAGPVYSEFRVSHPFGKNHYSTRVRMYPGVERIDIHTEILNQDQSIRYRLMFPIGLANGRNTQEIAFGALDRPFNQEFPAQNWMDYTGADRGVALLNRGLPGNNIAGNTMLLSLMRSARLISYGSIGGSDESSDSGLQLGKRIGFDYALQPHEGNWQAAHVFRAGLDFNNPLIARLASVHAGDLPNRWGMLDVSNDRVVISALKPSLDGEIAVRVYEAAGQPASGVRLRFAIPIYSVREANLIEDPGREMALQENGFTFSLRAFEIKTFRVRLARR
jgi:alpha-mannosidase